MYLASAGRVDAGCFEAAVRECEEEAGLRVESVGVLRFMLEDGICSVGPRPSKSGETSQRRSSRLVERTTNMGQGMMYLQN